MLDPNASATLTLDQVHDMVDELIDAHGDMIPEAIRRGSTRRSS
jgi:alpha-galactosidase